MALLAHLDPEAWRRAVVGGIADLGSTWHFWVVAGLLALFIVCRWSPWRQKDKS